MVLVVSDDFPAEAVIRFEPRFSRFGAGLIAFPLLLRSAKN